MRYTTPKTICSADICRDGGSLVLTYADETGEQFEIELLVRKDDNYQVVGYHRPTVKRWSADGAWELTWAEASALSNELAKLISPGEEWKQTPLRAAQMVEALTLEGGLIGAFMSAELRVKFGRPRTSIPKLVERAQAFFNENRDEHLPESLLAGFHTFAWASQVPDESWLAELPPRASRRDYHVVLYLGYGGDYEQPTVLAEIALSMWQNDGWMRVRWHSHAG